MTGALCHVTAELLTHCHLVILLPRAAPNFSPNSVTHCEYPDPPPLPSQLARRGSPSPSPFEDEDTEGQRGPVNLPRPQVKKGVRLRCKPLSVLINPVLYHLQWPCTLDCSCILLWKTPNRGKVHRRVLN